MSHTKNIMFVVLIAFMTTVLYGMALNVEMEFDYSETPNINDSTRMDRINNLIDGSDGTLTNDLTGRMSVVRAMQNIQGFSVLYAFILMFTGMITTIEIITIIRGTDS